MPAQPTQQRGIGLTQYNINIRRKEINNVNIRYAFIVLAGQQQQHLLMFIENPFESDAVFVVRRLNVQWTELFLLTTNQ